jgi:hypothetical protein
MDEMVDELGDATWRHGGLTNGIFACARVTLMLASNVSRVSVISRLGEHGHLHWQWGLGFEKIMPNPGFFYILVLVTVFFLMPDKIEAIFFSCFTMLLLIWRALWGQAEGSSVWCFSGVGLHVFYLVYPHVRHVLPRVWYWDKIFPCCRGVGRREDSKINVDTDSDKALANTSV